MRLPSSRGYDIIVEDDDEDEEEGVRGGRNVAESYMFSNDSNDGTSKNEERIEIRDGYPVKYKCMNTLQEDVDIHLLPITFDYEMTLEKNGKIQDNIQALEWSVLWNVVKEIGLHRCDFSQQTVAMSRISRTSSSSIHNGGGVRRGRRRRRTQAVLTPDEDGEEQRSYVLSLTSDAEDEIDIDTVHCQSSPATANEEICVPMRGGMSVVYTGNQPEMMERFLLEEIESVMSSGVVLVEDVKFVEYVGDRQVVIEPRGSSDSSSSTGSMLAFIGIAVGVAVISFVVVSLFVGLGVRRKRRRIGKLTVVEGVPRDLQIADTTSTESDGYRSPEAMAAAVAAANASCHSSATTVSSSSSQQQPTVSTSPKQVEHDGIMFEKPIAPGAAAAASNSVYLASTRQRRRKKGAGKKKRKSLRERVSVTPGVEPIPEGEFESFERDDWSEESDDEDDNDDDDSPTDQIPMPPNFSSPRGRGASELDNVLARAPSPPSPGKARTPSSHKSQSIFPPFRGNSELDRVLTRAVDGQWTSFESPTTPSYIVTRQHPQLPNTSPQSPHIFFPEDSDSSPEEEERDMPAPWI